MGTDSVGQPQRERLGEEAFLRVGRYEGEEAVSAVFFLACLPRDAGVMESLLKSTVHALAHGDLVGTDPARVPKALDICHEDHAMHRPLRLVHVHLTLETKRRIFLQVSIYELP